MFPINFNFPFRKSNGELTTIGKMLENAGGGGGSYTLPPATANTLGGVKIGEGIEVENDGTISASGGTPYELPPATANTLGGVKIGEGVTVASDGTISVTGGGGTTPTVDTITLDNTVSAGTLKMVKGDDGFIKVSGVVTLASLLTSDRVKIATGIPEKYRAGSTNMQWINLKVYLFDANYSDNLKESYAEIFGNGNIWVYYPTGSSQEFKYVYFSGVYRSDVYNG